GGDEHRLDDVLDRLLDERRGVVRHPIIDTLRELLLQLFSFLLDAVGDVERVGGGQLVDGQGHRRIAHHFAVRGVGQDAADVRVLGAQLDPLGPRDRLPRRAEFGVVYHLAEANVAAALAHLDNDVPELLVRGQPALGVQDELIGLPAGHRLLADVAGGHIDVLVPDGLDHLAGCQVQRRQLLRVEPDAHAVLPLAEERHQADAGQARQLVEDVDLGVVAQAERVPAAVGRDEVDREQDVGRFHLHVDAFLLHAGGQLRHGQLDADLGEHQGGVDVGADVEADGERVHAVVRTGRGHVDHTLDAVDLLLDRLADPGGPRPGAGPRVRGP